MLFRRDLVERIGMLDESFGTGNFEDDDFCLRAALEGCRNLVAGDVFIHHYGSMSFIMNRTDYDSALKMNDFREKWSNIDQKNIFGKKLVAIGALDRAQEFKYRGQADKAVQTLLETLDSIHEEREIYYFLVEILIDIKKYDEALKILESMPDDSDTDISKLVLIGYCKEGLGLLTEAVGYAEQVLCLDTSNAAALNLKGILAYKQKHYQAAEELFRQAIKVDPGYGKPYCNLGLLNLATGQHQEALGLMEQGFILSPTSTDIAASYHNAVTMSKQFARAEIIFRETKVIYPHNKQIIFLLIDLLLRQVKYADAMVEIEQAMVLFGYEQGILAAALDIRNKIGPKEIDAASKKNNPLSLCMVVKNDEPNLARCFKNIKSIAQEIIIVDLCSNDRTKEIATAFGAKVYDAPKTENMDELRSFSFAKATGDWILVLDADESISPLDYPPLTNLIAQQGLRQTAYAFIIRNYLTPVHLPGWIANDGKYINEETGTGWVPSKKVRLFPKDNRIRFSNSACETLASSLNDLGICIESCEIPIHHYGKLDVV
jgi:tetratricopeptide (TPR) repeat protein